MTERSADSAAVGPRRGRFVVLTIAAPVLGMLASLVLSLALASLLLASPAVAQAAPETLSPEAAAEDGAQDEMAPHDPPALLHHWRATLDYSYRDGPLVDVNLSRNGDAHSSQIVFGLEAGIGSRGFGRIEAGVDFSESDRTLAFDDMHGDYDRRFIGGSGGIFIFPFLAVGAQARYGTGEEEDTLTNLSFGEVTRTSREDEEWRVAPFGLLTAPVGPVQLSLLGGYVHIARESDYSDPLLPDNDKASMDLWVVNFGADWHVTPDFRLGANVGWTEITDQDLQFGAVALDEEWGSVDGHVAYRLFDGFEVTLRGGHDFDNSQGNGYRVGGGLAYRF